MKRGSLLAYLCTLGLASGCADEAPSLTVDLRTDLIPVREFSRAEAELIDATGEVGQNVARFVITEDDFIRGERIATFDGLEAGEHLVRVAILRDDGTLLVQRRVRVAIDDDYALTVVVTRDCLFLTCPGMGDPSDATQCAAGQCVPERCSPQRPDLCPPPGCATNADCAPPTAACAGARCIEGSCVDVPFVEACGPDQWCDPDVGCTASTPSDAGLDAAARQDAETDAGVEAGTDAGTDAGFDSGFDAGHDGGFDAGFDAGHDAGHDAGFDAGHDAGFDAGHDAGFDAGFDAGHDAGHDAGFDAGHDAGFDAGHDAGFDAGTDAGVDAGVPLSQVLPLFPWNGYHTGSIHSASTARSALRPNFRWRPVPSADRYELEIDDSCAIANFRSCAFPSPEHQVDVIGNTQHRPSVELPVSFVAPVGRRYYWRVRACAGSCGAWSTVRYLEVGRQQNDFNGDGYADLALGSARMAAGKVEVYAGSSTGISAGPAWSLTEGGGPPLQPFAAACDVNGDGFGDLLTVRVPSSPRIDVYFGQASGIGGVADRSIPSPTTGTAFTSSSSVVCGGDVDGDGYGDILASDANVSHSALRRGSVYVFRGRAVGPETTPSAEWARPIDDMGGGIFGIPTPAGDLNGDGFNDVAVMDPSQDDGPIEIGLLFLYYGESALDDDPLFTTVGSPVRQFGENFGYWTSAVGDLNDDGLADLVAGARFHNGSFMDQGQAYVILGSETVPLLGTTIPAPLPQVTAFFGVSTTGGDFDADGRADVVVAADAQSRGATGEGNVYVFPGTSSGLGPPLVLDSPANEAHATFGSEVGNVGDLNGDGYEDLVALAPLEDDGPNEDVGAAHVYYGGPAGVPTVPTDTRFGDADNTFIGWIAVNVR